MKTMKKMIAALLLVCMLTALCGAGAYAAGGTLTLSNPNITLDLNGKKQDSAGSATAAGFDGTQVPADGWAWKSNDEELVTVDVTGDITATGKKTGSTTCVLTATMANGDKWTGTVNVTVTDSSNVPVASITVSAPTYLVTVGGTLQLSAQISPENATNKALAWSTDPNAPVEVNRESGLVTVKASAKAGETAVIVATALDGSNVTGTYAVTIKAADPVPATDFYFEDASDVTLNPNSSVCRADKVRYAPSNATTGMNVNWSITGNENNVVSFDPANGTVTNDKGIKTDATVYVNATLAGTSITRSYKVIVKAVALSEMTVSYKSQMATTETSGQKFEAKDNASGAVLSGVSYVITANTTGSNASVSGDTLLPGSKASVLTIEARKDGYKTYAFTVTVTEPVSGVAITIVPSASVINSKNGVITLTATLTQDGKPVSRNISWSVTPSNYSGASIAAVAGDFGTGVYKANLWATYNGDYDVTVKLTDDNVVSAPCRIQVRFTPAIVEGNNAVFNGKDALYFIVNDHISNFDGNVSVDGVALTAGYHYDYMSAPDGRILIGLRAGFLSYVNQNSSANAYHSIAIGDKYASPATGYFRTWGTASSFNGVKTGDDSNLGLWTALLIVSAVGAGAAVVVTKRRKENG